MKRLIRLTVIVFSLAVLTPVLPPAEAGGLKVDIIHKGRLISVSMAAVPAHLAHGDVLADVCMPPDPCSGGGD